MKTFIFNYDMYSVFGRILEDCNCRVTVETEKDLLDDSKENVIKDGDITLKSVKIEDSKILDYMSSIHMNVSLVEQDVKMHLSDSYVLVECLDDLNVWTSLEEI